MKEVVVCVDLTEDSLKRIKRLHDDVDLKHSRVHLVHVFEIQYYMSEFTPYVFPTEEQYKEMEDSTLKILDKLAVDMGVSQENRVLHCFFSRNREDKIRDYLNQAKADLAVVATKGRHGVDGIFYNSLTDYLCKYSPCDVLVIRPH